MKNNGKVRDVRSLACKIKVLNGRVPGTWKWTIYVHVSHIISVCHLISAAVLSISAVGPFVCLLPLDK